MQAKYTVESESDFSKMFNGLKDVNAWYALERLTKSLQQEICEEIDREIIKKLKEGMQFTCPSSSDSSSC